MCVITEEGAERIFIPGDKLPRFWEGKEVLPMETGAPRVLRAPQGAVPIEVE